MEETSSNSGRKWSRSRLKVKTDEQDILRDLEETSVGWYDSTTYVEERMQCLFEESVLLVQADDDA